MFSSVLENIVLVFSANGTAFSGTALSIDVEM